MFGKMMMTGKIQPFHSLVSKNIIVVIVRRQLYDCELCFLFCIIYE